MAFPALLPPPFRPPALRSVGGSATALHIALATAALLFGGVILSILTTPDPLWWHEHFSRLGTFAVFSGFSFNATMVCTGAGVVVFACRLRVELIRHLASASLPHRRGARVVPILIVLVGLHTCVIGLVPVNMNGFIHDRGSTGAALSFVAVLAGTRWLLRGVDRAVRRATRIVTAGLVVTTALYATAVVNLAGFELVVFSFIFWWLLVLARAMRRVPATAHDAHGLAASRALGAVRGSTPTRRAHAVPHKSTRAPGTHTHPPMQPRRSTRSVRAPDPVDLPRPRLPDRT